MSSDRLNAPSFAATNDLGLRQRRMSFRRHPVGTGEGPAPSEALDPSAADVRLWSA